MMVSQRHRRTREVTGPTPHSVAIFARPPNKKPPEQLILERRAKEDQRQQAEELTKYNKLFDLKNDWERWTDRKIQINTVKRRVDGMLQAHQGSIEDRRERLRHLLAAEEAEYLQEMADSQETVLERQANMRARAKSLKEKRESERLSYVQDKLDQQWRAQCEELRGTMSKRHQDQVAAERMEQLRIKSAMQDAEKEQEKMYADLWFADMQAKMAKEEAETQRQMAANRDTLDVLQKQMAALEAQKQEERRLVAEEARLLKEQSELRKLEEKAALEEKHRKQQETRNIYDQSLKMKLKKQAREMQEQLAFDMQILEKLLEESRNEAMEQAQRKRELREEDQRYREYLQRLREEQERNERELERVCDAEVEKMWQKKLAQWRLEKEARQKLLQEVLMARKMQIEDKIRKNEMKMREAAVEREHILQTIEDNKRMEQEQMQRLKQQNLQHQNDLIEQMKYNRSIKEDELVEEEAIWKSQQEAELEYRRKLEHALQNPREERMHPIRRGRQPSAHQQTLYA